ncbi:MULTISPECIES: 3-hydroxybutyrate dehydrogenase [unclassified Bradyrhizobium]|uniref:3-hydroxybutyrate dehydrogenase n=1 Tax=unclassified Bradyrhizobium TaxID=2631580 RepID=UPI001FFB6D2F|nr:MULTISPECIES: 3-hydroxybutyrate dehydrogenase [unclassified Bradyrhizobium]MCK1420187.1 3-hydroxybutyrate dehydrogenase [Bradyrhizobium sp. CW12]MCK1647360.1 3-hydroxybutyrate dehydrogenase [Bradyrhizobium sp. 154]
MIKGNLKGRIALVTGSTSGIGLAIAQRLAREGATVCLHGLGDASQVEAAISAVTSASGLRPRHFEADLTDPDAAERLIKGVEQAVGSVDILINSAGIQHVAPLMEFTLERWNAVLAVNLTAAFLTIQRALPAMLQRNWGRIINISSVSGYVGVSHKAAYAASKHGLLGLTKVVSSETARTGVTCNAICPGWVLTPLVERQIEARAIRERVSLAIAQAEMLSASQPSGQFVKPEQVAGMVLFLCSPDADEVRGVGWNMDGGRLASR